MSAWRCEDRGEEEAWVWHAQFSHLHFATLREMDRYGLVHGMPLLTQVEQVCEACLTGIHCRSPVHERTLGQATEVLQLLHSDLLQFHLTINAEWESVLLVDDRSWYMWLSLLPRMDATSTSRWRLTTSPASKFMHSTWTKEFLAKDSKQYYIELGLCDELACPTLLSRTTSLSTAIRPWSGQLRG